MGRHPRRSPPKARKHGIYAASAPARPAAAAARRGGRVGAMGTAARRILAPRGTRDASARQDHGRKIRKKAHERSRNRDKAVGAACRGARRPRAAPPALSRGPGRRHRRRRRARGRRAPPGRPLCSRSKFSTPLVSPPLCPRAREGNGPGALPNAASAPPCPTPRPRRTYPGARAPRVPRRCVLAVRPQLWRKGATFKSVFP